MFRPEDPVRPWDEVQKAMIEHALIRLQGNVSLTAHKLGIGRATLYRKIEGYGLRDLLRGRPGPPKV